MKVSEKFIQDYNPSSYPPFAVTVDLNIFTIKDGVLNVLLIERGEEPFKDCWAFPGGFTGVNESTDEAASRELFEETGIGFLNEKRYYECVEKNKIPIFRVPDYSVERNKELLNSLNIDSVVLTGDNFDELRLARSRKEAVIIPYSVVLPKDFDDFPFEDLGDFHLEQLRTYSSPDRDPRMRVVSVAYVAFAADLPDPIAGDDASDARWWPVEDLLGESPEIQLAFDHSVILADALERVRNKIEYTTLATRFVPEVFTLSDLWRVYKIVWGIEPPLSNFRRKVLSVDGFVVPLDAVSSGNPGPKAKLYRSGDAEQMFPAMMRDQFIN